MKAMQFVPCDNRDRADGTSLCGSIDCSYDEVVAVFGVPDFYGSDDDKVKVEWINRFEDGTIATIYDYKSDLRPEANQDWHIGGFRDEQALEKVLCAMGIDPEQGASDHG